MRPNPPPTPRSRIARLRSHVSSLRSGVILGVLVPLLVVFGLGGLLVLGRLENRLEARLQDDIAVIARTLRVPIARSLERERVYSLDRALRSASGFGRVYGVYVYDGDGAPVARAEHDVSRSVAALTEIDAHAQPTSEYRSMDGREVYSYFTPLTDSAGNAIGMLQVTRSASEMREYLAALRANGAIVILASCAFFVAIIVAGHHLVVGRPLRRLAEAMTRIGGGDRNAHAAVRGPEEIRWLACRFNAMVDGLAERDRVLAGERAHQEQLERKLRQSEKYALVGRLASGVAHELGAPLNVVDGHAQRLMRRRPPGSPEHESLARIRESAARMVTIVRQLLGFARESREVAGNVPVERLISLTVADVRAQFDAEGAELELLGGAPETRLRVDAGRLREALVHLLRNALYASGGGRVRVGWARDEHTIRVFVEDSGPGIPPEDRERIFEPFFTTKPPGVGSGLGLAIVKGTVADQGAEIRVYDAPLGGAGIEIELPAGPEPA